MKVTDRRSSRLDPRAPLTPALDEPVVAVSLCPQCATEIDIDEALWLVHGQFYCGEACAAKSAGRR